jgi:Transposase DDE domain
MPQNYAISTDELQASSVARHLAQRLILHMLPFLKLLDDQVDHRLVLTAVLSVASIIMLRNRSHTLLLSELGGYILDPLHAPAGTKRLSNLLHCAKWQASLLEHYLWTNASRRLTDLKKTDDDALLVWDESVIEKPESIAIEGLSSVRSSKAARLTRIKPGFYQKPKGKVFVPGMQWLSVLLLGMSGAPTLAAMKWWTTRGAEATTAREVEAKLLDEAATAWGRDVIHVFDRGFAGSPWLGKLVSHNSRWIMRWPKGYQLLDYEGQWRKTWQISRGKRSTSHRQIWDAARQCWRKSGLVALRCAHRDYAIALWLVVVRPGRGQQPWYLLTNEPVADEAGAWRIALAYARRWQIEQAFRYCKSELGFESPRTWDWESRIKLLLLASMAYSYMLSLLDEEMAEVRAWLLEQWCHRTGKRLRRVAAPLYRLRAALSRLWLAHLPPPTVAAQTSG